MGQLAMTLVETSSSSDWSSRRCPRPPGRISRPASGPWPCPAVGRGPENDGERSGF